MILACNGDYSGSNGEKSGSKEQPTPILDISNPLDIKGGPIQLNNQEILGNQSAHLQSYLGLRQKNYNQLQKLIKIRMTPGLEYGIDNQAIVITLEGLRNSCR